MSVKLTMLFQLTTNISHPLSPNRRIGGWSESWYFPGQDAAAARAAALNGVGNIPSIMSTRAGFLPNGAAIIGARFQVVDPRGPSQSIGVSLPGTYNVESDVPQMALLVRIPGVGVNNVRTTILRGLPDDRVREGELFATQAFAVAIGAWVTSLPPWRFRGRDLSQPTIKMISISSTGVVATETPHGYGMGDMVRISRTVLSSGDFGGGRFQVSVLGPGALTFTVLNWDQGLGLGGSVRKDGIIYPQPDISNLSFQRVVVRKVGRPFVGYRGRRSRRRT
jgi:hypothetical protein